MGNKIIRQLQIDLINDTYNPIIEWFNELWSKLSVIETNVYHNSGGENIYYMVIDGKKQWIFFQDINSGEFWCDYNIYWRILEDRFNFEYDDVRAITNLLIENALNKSNNGVSNADIELPISLVTLEKSSIVNALNKYGK